MRHLLRILAALLALISPSALPGQSAPPEEQFKQLLKQARDDVAAYTGKGGARGAPGDPRIKWAEEFWRFREAHALHAAAGDAARESLRFSLDAGRLDTAFERIATLSVDDRAWRAGALSVLRDAAIAKGAPEIFLDQARALATKSADAELRARAHFAIGRYFLSAKKTPEAESAFEAAVQQGDQTEYGRRSARELHDLRNLNVGQPAPSFSVTSLGGKSVSNQSLRGHATVFVYWASW